MALPILEERLSEWATHLERLQWSAMILDSDWRLSWVSSQLKEFVKAEDDDELGYGEHIAAAFIRDRWLRTVHPGSQIKMFLDLAPFMLSDLERRGMDPLRFMPEQFLPLLEQIEPMEAPYVWSTSFMYVNPEEDPDLPEYRVDCCFLRIHSSDGTFLGWLILYFMGVQPNLLALLARGDERMYERMARLVEPAPRQAAIMFCDLHRSGPLSRQLPSSTYFKLVRRLWTGIDAAVADEAGIIGKHAGDGASAFFLVEDSGSPSGAAAAAVRAARRVHEVSEEVFRDILDTGCMMKVGIHWGGSLYMGQLVPGGRLDVTALGDEVNEAARLQEAAPHGNTLASKQLLEQLTMKDAGALGVDVDTLLYKMLAELPDVPEKAVRDAGTLPVTAV